MNSGFPLDYGCASLPSIKHLELYSTSICENRTIRIDPNGQNVNNGHISPKKLPPTVESLVVNCYSVNQIDFKKFWKHIVLPQENVLKLKIVVEEQVIDLRNISYPQKLASLSIKLGFDNFENDHVGVLLSKFPKGLGYLKFMQCDESKNFTFYWEDDGDEESAITLKRNVIFRDGKFINLLQFDSFNVELEGDWTLKDSRNHIRSQS
ncbi:unnamed protein product [Ambrosiozyma monospora]|uniref:Unnamed protein product n=1 Tax=Ambrosiozyma monospora TaxID=43982 RepID=A0ACB5TR30_AMBMO|nr:unnamed protein product [Ambrosiozyma monospora]